MNTSYIYFKAAIISAAVSFIISVLAIVVVLGNVGVENSQEYDQRSDRPGQTVERKINSEDMPVVDVVRNTNPAVVSIVITRNQRPSVRKPSIFDLFFGPGRIEEEIDSDLQIGGGSGFFVSKDGYIVTNRHVVNEEGAQFTVLSNDGKEYPAAVVARDPFYDIAILRVEGNEFPYLSFADSDSVMQGERVIAIGNALGEFRNTVSVGVVSGLSRSIVAGDMRGNRESLENVIQTDAAINVGNSGGPLLDLNGLVVGVNVATAVGSQNIGFALPSNIVAPVVRSVIERGEIVYPFIGIRYTEITPFVQSRFDLSVNEGIYLESQESVIPQSPAFRAGLRKGDIITHIDEVKIDKENSLGEIVRSKNVGDTIVLKVLRNNTTVNISVILDRYRVQATQ